MKRCPTCQKTFSDSLRFCQTDGTLLVDETENAVPSVDQNKTVIDAAPINDTFASQLPEESDSEKTIIATDSFSDSTAKNESKINDIFSPESSSSSSSTNYPSEAAPPKFDLNSMSDAPSTQPPFGSSANQPNYQPPFNEPQQNFGEASAPFNESPFDSSQNQFGGQPIQQSQWTPPPAPDANWQNQNIGANTPFQPPMAVQGQDKTLAIVALVCGILSLTCCGPVTGIAALITGFMAKNNVEANPQQYDGRGMAIAGMIMGGISLVLTVLYFIFVGFVGFIGR